MSRILVVEDSRTQAMELALLLEDAGFEVEIAADADRALDVLKRKPFDLVLSDLHMPGQSGFDLCRRIKADAKLAAVPVVVHTAQADPANVLRGLEAGADDFMTKDRQPDQIIERLRRVLDRTGRAGLGTGLNGPAIGFFGQKFTINAGREQLLNVLVSAFEDVVHINQRYESELVQRRKAEAGLEAANTELAATNERMKHDLEAAARIQKTLLPMELPRVNHAAFAWTFRPCEELAGDLLNVLPIDDRHCALYLFDVSGHGVAASLLSVTVNHVLTSIIPGISADQAARRPRLLDLASPALVAERLAKEFPWNQKTGQFFTLLYGVLDLDASEFRFISAGHPGPIFSSGTGVPVILGDPGLPIGLGDPPYEEFTVGLKPSDRLYIYSDGLTDAMNPDHGIFGWQRLVGLIGQTRSSTLKESVDSLLQGVAAWCGPVSAHDDISVLAVEVT